MTSPSTGSAWGPHDWSSHGGGGSRLESPADRAFLGPSDDTVTDDTVVTDDDGSADVVLGDGEFVAVSRAGSPGRRRASRRRPGRDADRAAGQDAADAPGATTPTDPASRARDICLRLLTGSARTRKQLADALRRREIPDEIAAQVLDRLTEVGLIDDAAYARSWVEQRQRSRGLARRALAGELRAKGVDSSLVAEAVAEVDPEDEEAAARRLVERKLTSTRGLDRQVRLRRLAGMLARRGYPEGLALRVVRAALDAEGTDDFEDDAFLDSGVD